MAVRPHRQPALRGADPIMMNVGETWSENLSIGSLNAQKPTIDKVSSQLKEKRFIQHDFYEKPSPIK